MPEQVKTTFSNGRLSAIFHDWPFGSQKCTCKFEIETNNKGSRCLRTTSNKSGGWNKPKMTTYAAKTAIFDGSDGKTYVAQLAEHFHMISIYRSDFMSEGTVFKDSEPELYAEMLKQLNEAK